MPLAMWEIQSSRKKDLCEERAPETFPELSASASLSIEENAHFCPLKPEKPTHIKWEEEIHKLMEYCLCLRHRGEPSIL